MAYTNMRIAEIQAELLQMADTPEGRGDVAELACALMLACWRSQESGPLFERCQASGLHVLPVHYYSPIPDTRELPASLWATTSRLPGIDLREAEQLQFLTDICPRFQSEYDGFAHEPSESSDDYWFQNPMFSGTDALVLYGLIRHLRPQRVLEVGSGFSSRVTLKALRQNGSGRLTCVEPHPSGFLKQNQELTLIESRVQEVPLEAFESLAANDVLFIDSSHVVRVGGDVNFLFLEVLPRLRSGVVVHVHDIFMPGELRKPWVLERHWFWSEQYLLQAFLMFNSAFEVVFANSFMGVKHAAALRRVFPKSPWWDGGSFWLRRK